MTEHTLYTQDPVIIRFNDGHKFPREISDKDFESLNTFLKKQWQRKYSNLDGF